MTMAAALTVQETLTPLKADNMNKRPSYTHPCYRHEEQPTDIEIAALLMMSSQNKTKKWQATTSNEVFVAYNSSTNKQLLLVLPRMKHTAQTSTSPIACAFLGINRGAQGGYEESVGRCWCRARSNSFKITAIFPMQQNNWNINGFGSISFLSVRALWWYQKRFMIAPHFCVEIWTISGNCRSTTDDGLLRQPQCNNEREKNVIDLSNIHG